MKGIKKILAFSLVAIISMSFFMGCSNRNSDKKVGIVLSTLNNPFFVSMKEGAEKEAEKLGFELIVLDSQNDPAKERSNVEDLIQLGVVALLINPTDSDAVVKSVEVANEANIPVITLDRQSNGGEVTSHIASDNIKGGAMAAEFVLEKLGTEANINVVELQGIPGASATRDRGAGFHSILDDKTNVKFVSSQAADFDRQKGLSVMENILQGNSDVQVVFAHNDEMALGAAKAIGTSNVKAMVIGFDGNEDALDAVEKGEMIATVAQQPDLIGALGVELALKIYNGEAVDKEIAADLKIVSNQNY
ncbi:ribose ABC transporter substrate-binding protein RbsB [Clostridium tertium]|jgi:ribose transport system substrate-binding protein|uniref:ribose ABC transporter substrate-binding protein RbsB n=1 Tax=Clostridium TaxID=1485 RepID=UPI001157F99E|nr:MULTISPECIES: ribose ABC transporter substrate-binding protein RbsB [Clostridium]MBS5884191.1 ribose ABC transporter substrate-binding protein RbsB [Clostridium sp.]MBS6500529.1 ribose ABC transporter substrate-binding protein RbsB [Clostridium sp.]MDB1924202.1 ribose ABC transporter substrate-binding protein RbsB [Clostridium tertium]MDB1927263.1 ribose ABC transporter substrate-binding protein RbsB [Clostridium tertium]MDB1929292.1 ribose ABC transporter substrate-binding protein RbsB [Cl